MMYENEPTPQRVSKGKRRADELELRNSETDQSLDSVQGLSTASSVSSEVPSKVPAKPLVRKRVKIEPTAITGNRFLDDGTVEPLTKQKGVDVNVHIPSVKPKGKDGWKWATPASEIPPGVELTPGLEFTDELLTKLGKLNLQ